MTDTADRSIQSVAVLGLGKIGLLAAELLAESGFEVKGYDTRFPRVRAFKPRWLAGGDRTAIAWTTAGSVVAVIEMVSDRLLPQKGFLKQEEIPFDAFLSTRTGNLYATSD